MATASQSLAAGGAVAPGARISRYDQQNGGWMAYLWAVLSGKRDNAVPPLLVNVNAAQPASPGPSSISAPSVPSPAVPPSLPQPIARATPSDAVDAPLGWKLTLIATYVWRFHLNTPLGLHHGGSFASLVDHAFLPLIKEYMAIHAVVYPSVHTAEMDFMIQLSQHHIDHDVYHVRAFERASNHILSFDLRYPMPEVMNPQDPETKQTFVPGAIVAMRRAG